MSQSSKNIVIDRIEGNIAVVEHNGQHHDIPLSILPDGSKEEMSSVKALRAQHPWS